MPLLLLLILPLFLFWILSPLHPRDRAYHTFRIRPDLDWTNPATQESWRVHGELVGRFLSVETPLTVHELVVLCRAYAVQHGSPRNRPVTYMSVDYDLQSLWEESIVCIDEWQAFPTSPRSYETVRLPRRKLTEEAE